MSALAWRSGLRIGEVLALKPKDIDLDRGTITIQHGKGDKQADRRHRREQRSLGGPLGGCTRQARHQRPFARNRKWSPK
jgi:integrase